MDEINWFNDFYLGMFSLDFYSLFCTIDYICYCSCKENTGNILEVVVMLVDSIITGSILINCKYLELERANAVKDFLFIKC